jgi:hypothetical protein
MRLAVRWLHADSAAIEDIPSSMQPQGIHHEHQPAIPLQLQHLSRHQLHLWLPACRGTNRLCLWPAVPLRRTLHLRHGVHLRRWRQLRPSLIWPIDPAPLLHPGTRP